MCVQLIQRRVLLPLVWSYVALSGTGAGPMPHKDRSQPRTCWWSAAGHFEGHDIMAPGEVFRDDRIVVTAIDNTQYAGTHANAGADADKSYACRFETPGRSVVICGDTDLSEALDGETDLSQYTDGVRKFYAGPVIAGRDLLEY